MGLPNIIQNHTNDITTLTTKHTALETKHNTLDSSVVKLTGNQSVDGTKTFTSIPYVKGTGPALNLQNTSCVKGTTPTSNNTFLINCFENAGTASKNRIGLFQTYYNTSGSAGCGMWVYQPVADSTTSASLQVVYPASGNPYASCPTPDSGSNTTHIATTAWVRGKGVLIESYISGTTWYRKYSDGWIEQGGQTASWSNNPDTTISLYKAFSNTNYSVSCINIGSTKDGYTGDICLKSKATSSFVINCHTNNRGGLNWHACGK